MCWPLQASTTHEPHTLEKTKTKEIKGTGGWSASNSAFTTPSRDCPSIPSSASTLININTSDASTDCLSTSLSASSFIEIDTSETSGIEAEKAFIWVKQNLKWFKADREGYNSMLRSNLWLLHLAAPVLIRDGRIVYCPDLGTETRLWEVVIYNFNQRKLWTSIVACR